MKKREFHVPKKPVRCYLRTSLFLTLLAAIALLISYLDARAIDRVGAAFTYAPCLEYVMASLFISLGGALFLENLFSDPRFQKRK